LHTALYFVPLGAKPACYIALWSAQPRMEKNVKATPSRGAESVVRIQERQQPGCVSADVAENRSAGGESVFDQALQLELQLR
jgi:hypothetical protein